MSNLKTPPQANALHFRVQRALAFAAAICLFGQATAVAAQVTSPLAKAFDAFWIPTAATDCEVRAASAEDSLRADSVIVYQDGEELVNMRFISVGYGHDGTPIWLQARVDEPLGVDSGPVLLGRSRATRTAINGFVILYRSAQAAWGTRLRGMRVDDSPLAALQRGKVITDREAEDAKSLAVFLLHVCRPQARADRWPFSFFSSVVAVK